MSAVSDPMASRAAAVGTGRRDAAQRASGPGPAARVRPRRRRTLLARVLGCRLGVSAVEFALLAPVLVVGAFSTADAGRAIYEKMMIGQSLRAAAHLAMSGAEVEDVRAVLREVASQNFSVAPEDGGAEQVEPDGTGQAGALSIAVESYCACTGETFVQIGCTVVCTSGLKATQFYRLTASKSFDGVILPDFGLSGSVSVVAQ